MIALASIEEFERELEQDPNPDARAMLIWLKSDGAAALEAWARDRHIDLGGTRVRVTATDLVMLLAFAYASAADALVEHVRNTRG